MLFFTFYKINVYFINFPQKVTKFSKMLNMMKLKTDSVLQVPFQNYEKDFTFIVNSKRFNTSSFVADILSPTISKIHFNDPTIKEFSINTDIQGDFNHILNLLNFDSQEISEEEIPFIIEMIEILGIEKVDLNIKSDNEELTVDNIFQHIKKHQQHPRIYSSQLEKDVDFFTSHFHELKDQIVSQIDESKFDIKDFVFEKIIYNRKLQLDTEDDLLEIVNKLYLNDSNYSRFYEFVDFVYVDEESIKEFVNVFDFNDMTSSVWNSIVHRLQQEVKIKKEKGNEKKHESSKKEQTFLAKNNEFDGVLNYLQTHGNIRNEIEITVSSNCDNTDPFNLVDYKDLNNYIYTKNEQNSWISFDFKYNKVIPTGYIIRSYPSFGHSHLKTWVIEGSNDNTTWKLLDSQNNNSSLNGYNNVHLFPISINKDEEEPFRYLRIKQTGTSWNNTNNLLINSIDFYGKII